MKIFIIIVPLALLLACTKTPEVPPESPDKTSNKVSKVDGMTAPSAGGIGMTYGGKVGIELAPGLVMGFDGKVGPGFGF